MKSYKGLRENIPYPGHKCSDGTSPFLEGREQVEDEPRAGRPSTSKTEDNVERVRSLVRSDRRLTLRMISSELNLKFDSGKGWHVCDQHCTHLDAAQRQRPMSHGSLHQ